MRIARSIEAAVVLMAIAAFAGSVSAAAEISAAVRGPSEAVTGEEVVLLARVGHDGTLSENLSYVWTAEGETIGSGPALRRIHATAGVYVVRLVVMDGDVEIASASHAITVTEGSPRAPMMDAEPLLAPSVREVSSP